MSDRKFVGLTILAIVGVVLFSCILGWLVQGNNFFMYKVFAPAFENTRRDVFENTKSYRQGTIQELDAWYAEYNKTSTSDSQKDAIADVVLHRVVDFDMTKDDVPAYLRIWIEQLRIRRNTSR